MAIMMTLMDTGMRVGELVRLKVRDVNLNNGEIFIAPFSTGMKTKSRHVYIGTSTKNAIWKYLTQRKRRNNPEYPDDPLFMTVDRTNGIFS